MLVASASCPCLRLCVVRAAKNVRCAEEETDIQLLSPTKTKPRTGGRPSNHTVQRVQTSIIKAS